MSKCSIKNVPRYFAPYTDNCFQNAYGALVSHMKLNPNLILADYLSFMYEAETGTIGTNFLRKTSRSFVYTEEQLNASLEYVYFPAVTEFSRRMEEERRELPSEQIKIALYFDHDPMIAHSRMEELIDEGIPVIVLVDMYYMRYHRAYQKEHGAHAVIITGYNQEEGYVELFDKYGLASCDFDGRFNIDELILARNSDNWLGTFSKPINNTWMEVTKSDQFIFNVRKVNSILSESYRRMNGEGDGKYGLNRLNAFRRDLMVQLGNGHDDETLSRFGTYFYASFKALFRSRIRFSVFLREIAPMLHEGQIEEAAQFCEDSAKLWEICSRLALRIAATKNSLYIENLYRQLENIIDQESRVVEKLSGI